MSRAQNKRSKTMAAHTLKKTSFFLFFIFFLLAGHFVYALPSEHDPLQAKILTSSSHTGVHESLLMGVQINLAEGWYIYAPQKNTSHIPPHLEDQGSSNIDHPTLFWPPANIISTNGIEILVYTHNTLLPLIISPQNSDAPIDLNMLLEGVVCNQRLCIPYKIPLSLSIPQGPRHPTSDTIKLEEALMASSPSPKVALTASFFESFKTILIIVGSGFLGGIILNFMPCVLPVLSLKLLSLLKKKSFSTIMSLKLIKIRFLMSFLGILSFFILFAILTIILNYFGKSLGWGIQFQNSYFLGGLIIILILFSLNLWGFFEVRLPQWFLNWVARKNVTFFSVEEKTASHLYEFFLKDFAAGLLTAILATPCSAPFLGTALSASLTQPAFMVILIFLSIGTGLGLPYLIMMIYPEFIHKLPHSGSWMQTLKRFLSLGLLGTALWLSFILISPSRELSSPSAQGASWQTFNPEKLSIYINNGQSVLVNVTADWCLTCKTNKFFTFENTNVQKIFSDKNIILMQADWTHTNQDIELYLKSFKRNGIPLSVYYSSKSPQGIILPELLTPSNLIDFLNKN